ncbi:MAG: hypothetical protein C0490_05825 [Marivirga sp.]|nr:hypothetical protein [Marivirga sp.]
MLEKKLRDTVVSECFSQNKDELIIRFETQSEPFFIKASLLPSFSFLSFPNNFHRARKNSADLFPDLIGQRVQGIHQFKNERSFVIHFSNAYNLLFKMHGNRSNIILLAEKQVVGLFKNSIAGDSELKLETLDREILWTFDEFVKNQDKIESTYFTFGKPVWAYIMNRGYGTSTMEERWKIIQDTLQELNKPNFHITLIGEKLLLSLLPIGKLLKEFNDPIEALNDFFQQYTQHEAFRIEKTSALSILKQQLQSSTGYFEKTTQKLNSVISENNYKAWADLIMANLSIIKPGTERISLPSFYDENHSLEIRLKKDLSPQKNAEIYYKKSKNQQTEVDRLEETLNSKEKEIANLKDQIKKIESEMDLKHLRSVVTSLGLTKIPQESIETLPFYEVDFNGYKILIGKNAQSNDKLTLKYGYKEDLWLHAKDVAGSHVLIKYQSGKKFPKDVIERAAQLAAYHSKRKTDSLCPVTVTPRKFVRKRKGDPAGSVIVEREEVILVEPKR